jgi:hypothetical protein
MVNICLSRDLLTTVSHFVETFLIILVSATKGLLSLGKLDFNVAKRILELSVLKLRKP